MLPVLALFGALVVLAAGGALALQARRRRDAPDSAPAPAAPEDGDGAWVSRITQSIPNVVRRMAETEPPKARPGAGLQGNLAQTPLHDLLQFLALGRKTGVLELASGRRTGRFSLSEGRIARAAYRGKEGMEAAFLMLDLAEGDFEYYEAPEDRGPDGGAAPVEVVDAIMLWMARKPKRKQGLAG